jgi:hypothetical protein
MSDREAENREAENTSTMKKAAEQVGFSDAGTPTKLYTLWRKQVHRGVQNWDCFGPEEAGTSRWDAFCEWAAGQPTMAPRGQLTYHEESVRKNVRLLCDDVAKKARNSRQAMWEAVRQARAGYRGAHNAAPQHVEPAKWPLPAAQELGPPTTGPSYMPRNPKGKGGVGLRNATAESNAEKLRIGERGRQ